MYKDMGMYYEMVKAYLESFNHVHVILYEDFSNKVDDVLKGVFKFLEIDNTFLVDHTMKYNVGGKKWKNTYLKHIFQKASFVKKIVPDCMRDKIRKKLVSLSTNKVPSMGSKTKELLNVFFKEDINSLSKLIGRDLKHWIK